MFLLVFTCCGLCESLIHLMKVLIEHGLVKESVKVGFHIKLFLSGVNKFENRK